MICHKTVHMHHQNPNSNPRTQTVEECYTRKGGSCKNFMHNYFNFVLLQFVFVVFFFFSGKKIQASSALQISVIVAINSSLLPAYVCFLLAREQDFEHSNSNNSDCCPPSTSLEKGRVGNLKPSSRRRELSLCMRWTGLLKVSYYSQEQK